MGIKLTMDLRQLEDKTTCVKPSHRHCHVELCVELWEFCIGLNLCEFKVNLRQSEIKLSVLILFVKSFFLSKNGRELSLQHIKCDFVEVYAAGSECHTCKGLELFCEFVLFRLRIGSSCE